MGARRHATCRCHSITRHQHQGGDEQGDQGPGAGVATQEQHHSRHYEPGGYPQVNAGGSSHSV